MTFCPLNLARHHGVEGDAATDQRRHRADREVEALRAEIDVEAGGVPEPRRGGDPAIMRCLDEGVGNHAVAALEQARRLDAADLDALVEDRGAGTEHGAIGGAQHDAGAPHARPDQRRGVAPFEAGRLGALLRLEGGLDIDAGQHR